MRKKIFILAGLLTIGFLYSIRLHAQTKEGIIPEATFVYGAYAPKLSASFGVTYLKNTKHNRSEINLHSGYGLTYSTDYGVGKHIFTLYKTYRADIKQDMIKFPVFVEGRIGPTININEYFFPVGAYAGVFAGVNLEEIVKFPIYTALSFDYRFSFYHKEEAEIQTLTTTDKAFHAFFVGLRAQIYLSDIF